MKTITRIQSTLYWTSANGKALQASMIPTRRPKRPSVAARILCILAGVCALMLTVVPASAATLTYDFNSGTLQGWHNRVWDLSANAGAGGWVDLDANVTVMPVTINGGAIAPASSDNNLFGNNGTQVDPVGGSTDNHLNTLWLRSPQFYVDGSGDLTVEMARGMAHGSAPANDASVSHIANSSTGWKGVALRTVSDGAFVLAKPRTEEGDAMVAVTFTAAELAPYVGVKCTLDLINSENGGWGWLSMDNASIPGFGTQVLLEKTDPLIVVGIDASVLVSIPDGSNATSAVSVYITNSNPSVLTINGSAAPVVPVVFAAGTPYSQDVTVVGTAMGEAELTAGSAGLGSGGLTLTVLPTLLGHWISGAPNLSETSGFRPAGKHDGVAVGGNAAALAFSSDLPPGCTGQSLDLRAGNVGVMITNSATTDGEYLNSYDDAIRRKFTIAFWAKGFPGTWNGWVSKRGENNIGWQIRRMGSDPVAGFTLRGLDNSDGTGSPINVNDNSWHHYAGVWDQATGTRTLYVDGVLSHVVYNTVGQMMNLAAGKHLALGAREQGGAGFEAFFSGLLFDVRLYSYPLSESEVHALIPSAVNLATRAAVPVGGSTLLTVSIPSWANASAPVTVYLTNGHPSRVNIDGNAATVIPVPFDIGAGPSQILTLSGLAAGQAELSAGANSMASASANVEVFVASATPGLIGHWVAGAPHLADISGFTDGTHDGSFVGVPPTGNFTSDVPLGRPGQSLDLRGAGNIAVRINNTRTPDASYLPTYDDDIWTRFSVAFWAKGFPNSDWAGWVTKEGEDGRGWQIRRMGGNSIAGFTMRGIDNEDGWGSTINVNDNRWHHYAGVWDQATGTRTLYVDGVLSHVVNNAVGQNMNLAPNAPLVFGAKANQDNNYDGGRWVKCQLFDVRMYSTALANEDVLDLVGAVLASPSSLALSYPSPNDHFITITVPPSAVVAGAVSVVVTSDKPAVAIPEGAVAGVLTVTLPMGGANSASYAVQANGPGTAHFTYTCTSLPVSESATTTIAVKQPNISDLVAYWNFDEQTLAETAGFQPAGLHDGVAVGDVAYVPGLFGGHAVDLRAANTAVRIQSSLITDADYRPTFDAFLFDSPAGFSWSCWVKGLPRSDWASWIAKDGEATGYAVRKAGGSLITFTLRNSAGDPDDPTDANAAITDNLWHHLAAVYDPVALQRRLYVDGVERISITDSNLTSPPVNSPLFFGARDATGDPRFARVIVDEIRAYDKALSVVEITDQVGSPLITLTPGNWSPNLGDPDLTATITVPASMVATSTVHVTLTSADPAVAVPVGAVGGSLTVNFPMGGANTAAVALHAVGVGTTTVTGSSPASVVNGEIVVTVTTTPILLGHWFSGATNLVETSGYRPAGTHDGVAVGNNAVLLAFAEDIPANFTGQSLDLGYYGGYGDLGVRVANSATGDGGYQPTFDGDIQAKFTVAFWAKGFPTAEWAGWVTKDGEGAGWQLRRMGGDNVAGFTIRGIGGDPDGWGSGINVNDGNWHHYVGIWDQAAGTRTLYVDGVFSHVVYTTPNQAMSLATGAHLMFGGRENGSGSLDGGRYVSCLLFDARIYNAPLSEYRIQSLLTAAVAQPQLTVQPWAGNLVRISWPTSFTDFGIEQSSGLPDSWGPSGLSVTVEGDENVAYAPALTDAQYFRLKK